MKKKQERQQLALFEGGETAKPAGGRKSAALKPEAERLLANFEALAEAPEGGKRLRELILDLAVRGQLVSQNSNEEPASELLKRSKLQTAQAQLQKRRRIRASTPIATSEHPPLADGWVAARWSDVGLCQNGRAFPSDDYELHGVKLLRPGNLHASSSVVWNEGNTRYLPERYAVENSEFIVGGSELVMNLTAQSLKDDFLGRTCMTEAGERCLLNQRIARLTPHGIEPRYLIWYFRSPFFRRYVAGLNKGTLIQHMFTSQVDEAVILIPPLAEQARIVAKVDELMALCDEMEARQAKRRAAAGRLNKAALGELTSAEGPEELAASLQRVVGNFEAFVSNPEGIDELRMISLELALRGILVRQAADDEPAETLLARILAERATLLHGRRLGGRGHTSDDDPNRPEPYVIPSTWRWCSLADVAGHIVDGTHHTPKYVEKGMDFISAKNIKRGTISFEGCRQISKIEYDDLIKRCKPRRGDVLVTKSGSIGDVAVVDTDRAFTLFESVAVVPVVPSVNSKYIAHATFLGISGSFGDLHKKGVGVPHLHLVDLRRLPIPLPPLAEQARIVAKVDHLMSLCDALEAKLRAADEGARRLAESLVAELLG